MEYFIGTSGSVDYSKADIVAYGTDFDAVVDECNKREMKSGHRIFIFEVETEPAADELKGFDGACATSVYWVEQDMWYRSSDPLPTLDEIMNRSGLNKADLARRFGIPSQTVRKWFLNNGNAHSAAQYILSMMAEILFNEQRYDNK